MSSRKTTRAFRRERARIHTNYSSYNFKEVRQVRFIKKQLVNSKGNICGICGKPIKTMKECTIDHILPISKGGATTIENCQLAHPECNSLKGNKYPYEPTIEHH